MKKKTVFITNGMACSGKDTFAEILSKYIPTLKISSIDDVKKIATECGWDGTKDEKSRKFLSDLKKILTDFNDFPNNSLLKQINEFLTNDKYEILIIDIREPSEITKLIESVDKSKIDIFTILIVRDSIEQIVSNYSDANVNNFKYDYVLKNNDTIEDFDKSIVEFIDTEFGTLKKVMVKED